MNEVMQKISTLTLFLLIAGGATANLQGSALAAAEISEARTMREVIEATLANNPTVKAMQEYRQAAEFEVARAGSGRFPRVDIRGGGGMEQWSDSNTRRPDYGVAENNTQEKHKFYPRSDASLVITQNIYDGFLSSSRVRQSESMLDSADYRLLDNAEALSLDAVLAYIEVFRQRRLLELAEINVRNHKSILSSQMERQVAGVADLADVTQTQARVARSESTLTDTKTALQSAYTNFKKITGRTPAEILEIPTAPATNFPSLDNALSNSMTVNAKVLSKKADVESSYAQKEVDKAAFHPRLYLELAPSYSWQAQSSLTDSWGTAVQLRGEWNLFNGGYDANTLKSNKARIRQSNRELQALRDNLAKDTEDTWSQWQASHELVLFYSNAVLYNTQTRDMYLEQFNVGQRSLMDLLDSENELYSSSIQLVTAQLNEIAAQYRLFALGGKLLGYFGIATDSLKVATDQDDGTRRDLTGTTVNNHAFIPE
ncbi:MAG: TolC family protein [Desulfovibrionaceae bacterium]|nr:TolC family protein [Desulfovibrionaceae bacterium]